MARIVPRGRRDQSPDRAHSRTELRQPFLRAWVCLLKMKN